MTQMRNTFSAGSLKNELPQEILDQLDPKLAKLYSQLSPAVSSQVAGLVRRARRLVIHPNRLVKYAWLHVTAERQAQGDAVSKEHARRSKFERAGQLHGFGRGYGEIAEAQQRYRRGRRARQQIEASLRAVLKNWQRIKGVVLKHRADLPLHLQRWFSDERLAAIDEQLLDMRRAMALERDILVETNHRRELTVSAQTYIWWRWAMPRYKGKWNDMHRLAVAWSLSEAEDVETFRSIVVKICREVKSVRCPFGRSWESELSENP